MDAIASLLKDIALERVRVLANRVVYSNLNLTLIVNNTASLALSITNKTEALCRDANFVIIMLVTPLGDLYLNVAISRLGNRTWMLGSQPVIWLFSILINPSSISPPDFNDSFDQLVLGIDATRF